MRGFHTGTALGDALGGYTNPNPESISLPQSGTDAVWRQFFTLHDRYPAVEAVEDPIRTQLPEDGIDIVIISLSKPKNPLSSGSAELTKSATDAILAAITPSTVSSPGSLRLRKRWPDSFAPAPSARSRCAIADCSLLRLRGRGVGSRGC